MSGPVPSPSMKGTIGWSGTCSFPWEMEIFSPAGIFTRRMLPPQGTGATRTVRFPDRAARAAPTSLRERVQRRSGAEPANVLLGQAVASLNRDGPAVRLVDPDLDGPLRRQGPEAHDAHAVRLLEQVVVLGVLERKRQYPLLLQVGLVDAREALDQHGLGTEVSRRHGRVLPARALPVILVPDHHPAHALGLPVAGDPRERHPGLAGEHVHALAGLAGEGVHRAEEHVVADLVEVATEAEPRPGRRDVVRRRLALRLDEDREVLEVLPVPPRERLEELEPLAVGPDDDLHPAAVRRGRLE